MTERKLSDFKYRALNTGVPGRLTIYDQDNKIVGELTPEMEIGVDKNGFFFASIKGIAFSELKPEFADKSLTDYQFFDEGMGFNIS